MKNVRFLLTTFMFFVGYSIVAISSASAIGIAPVDCFGTTCSVTSDPGTSISYDATSGDPDLTGFTLNGVNHLFEQELELIFRVNGITTTGKPHDLDFFGINLTGATANDVTNTISLNFAGVNGLAIQQTYALTGSALSNTITLTNTSAGTFDMSLFLYTDFDLNGNSDNDSSSYNGVTKTFSQTDPQGNITATVQSNTTPSFFDSTLGPGEGSILGSSFSNHLKNRGGQIGPGDARNAFEYDFTLNNTPNWPITISSTTSFNTQPVPEPSTLLLLGSGLIGLIGYNYRRRKQAVV